MSKTLILPSKLIIPTEDNLAYICLYRVFHGFWNNYESAIPPVPVRQDPKNNEKYLVLDGHHRTSIAELFQKERPYFLVESREDLMRQENFPNTNIERMNFNIQRRWDRVIDENYNPSVPDSFKELNSRYLFLDNIEDLKTYFEKDGKSMDLNKMKII